MLCVVVTGAGNGTGGAEESADATGTGTGAGVGAGADSAEQVIPATPVMERGDARPHVGSVDVL